MYTIFAFMYYYLVSIFSTASAMAKFWCIICVILIKNRIIIIRTGLLFKNIVKLDCQVYSNIIYGDKYNVPNYVLPILCSICHACKVLYCRFSDMSYEGWTS